MAVAIALALLSWRVAVEHDQREADLRFKVVADDVAEAITARLDGSEFALRAAGALFDSSQRVDRDEWRRFVGGLRADATLPGLPQLIGLGFARHLRTDDVDEFVERLRAEGFDAASIARGSDASAERVVVEMIEPLDARNRRAIGFDMASDPIRRAALESARDSGQPTLSAPVRLLQETADDGARPGVLLVLPVYRTDQPPTSVEARRDAIAGYVYSPLRIGELLRDMLPADVPGLAFALHDGADADQHGLLHATASTGDAVRRDLRVLDVPGRRWTLSFSGSDAFERYARSRQPLLVAAVGGAMSIALLLYLRSEARERRRAAGEAQRLAAEVDGRRGAEQAMRVSERQFREVVEASPTGLLMADASGRILLANPQAERLFGYGAGELLGLDIDALVPDALRDAHRGERAEYLRAPARRAMGAGRDIRGRRRDGTEVPLEIGLSPIGDAASHAVLAAVVDLSGREAEQRQLESALREKTLLLDEVHHRVKNNLQVITSLLSLQARGAPPEARAALAECRNRVHAMALTHQLLHENGDVARLQVGEYLRRLGRMLADSHRAASPSVALRIEGAETPLYLELPRAIPCGLVVNELVTHAYRHAFPDGRAGTIVVGLALDGDDAWLSVADDGVDQPILDDGDPGASLGEQLVPLLVDQLGGTFTRAADRGTRFDIRFPRETGRSR